MPTTQSPLEPGQHTPEQEPEVAVAPAPNPDAPLTFVPHEPPPAPGAPPPAPIRFRTNRYGELEEHELVRLLDTIEDERARGRFRESIYISLFFWIAVAWLVFYGPRYLWHTPQLINPADAIRKQELTQLNLPTMHRSAPPAPKAVAPVNRQTIKQLQTMTKAAAIPTPAPTQPSPTPTPPVATNTAPPTPQPLPSAPQPRTPVASVPDAPTPQPNAHPNFSNGSDSPGTTIGRALGRPGGGHDFHGDSNGGPLDNGATILSDTQGVDFGPYIRRILSDIKRNWEPLLPEETRPPISKQGETYVRFKILPDGNIQAMALDGSTHDIAIDHSCWSSITSEGQFPPLPANFHGPNLELRIHFLVNKDLRQ